MGIPHPSTTSKDNLDLFADPEPEYLSYDDVPEAEFSDFSSSEDDDSSVDENDEKMADVGELSQHGNTTEGGENVLERSDNVTELVSENSRRVSVSFNLGARASGDNVSTSASALYVPPRVVLPPGSPVVSRQRTSIDFSSPLSTPTNHSYGTRAQRRRQSMQGDQGFLSINRFIPIKGISVGKWLQSHSISDLKRQRDRESATSEDDTVAVSKKSRMGSG